MDPGFSPSQLTYLEICHVLSGPSGSAWLSIIASGTQESNMASIMSRLAEPNDPFTDGPTGDRLQIKSGEKLEFTLTDP